MRRQTLFPFFPGCEDCRQISVSRKFHIVVWVNCFVPPATLMWNKQKSSNFTNTSLKHNRRTAENKSLLCCTQIDCKCFFLVGNQTFKAATSSKKKASTILFSPISLQWIFTNVYVIKQHAHKSDADDR